MQALEMNGMNNKEYVPIIIVGTYTNREPDRPWAVVGNSPTNGDPDVLQLYEQAIVVSFSNICLYLFLYKTHNKEYILILKP